MHDHIEAAAAQLRQASTDRIPCRPVREILPPDAGLGGAYAVQSINADHAVASGRRVSGRKVGLTAKPVQQFFETDEPISGPLFADMCVADGDEIPNDALMQPRAEGEIALVLASDLDRETHDVIDVINATAYVLPAIEIADSRIVDWDRLLIDTIADGAGAGLYVVGTRPVELGQIDLRTVEMSMERNGTVVSSGRGAACLGNPLIAVVWLADAMCAAGTPLLAGQLIMTGALGPMVPFDGGDHLDIDMGRLGSVSTTWRAASA